MNDMPDQRPEPSGEVLASPAELQAIAVRMRGLDRGAVPPVDAAWIERVVAAATVGVVTQAAPVRALPRWRQFAAAVAAFCGLHTGAIAMSTVAVGAAVAVAVAVWPEERHSLETMSLAMAVELLQRADESDAARAAAAVLVAIAIRDQVDAWQRTIADAGAAAPPAAAALDRLRRALRRSDADLRAEHAWPGPGQRPLAVAASAAGGAPSDDPEQACALLAVLRLAPQAGPQLDDVRASLLQRLRFHLGL